MFVVREYVAFGFLPAAVNVTKKSPWSADVGCQVSVPAEFPDPGVKTASFPGGSAERLATSEEMGLQFVGAACTSTTTGSRYLGSTIPGAKTWGAALGEPVSPSLSDHPGPSRFVWSNLGPWHPAP